MAPDRPASRRIFLECTDTYLAGGNTGIQRVVRNTISHCQNIGREIGVICQPVVWDEALRQFRKINAVELRSNALAGTAKNKTDLLKLGKQFIRRMPAPLPKLLLQRHVKFLVKQAARGVNASLWLPWRRHRAECVNIISTDVLFLLDSTWHSPPWTGLRQAKRNGATIGAMLYDLVPVFYPQTCDENLVRCFHLWLKQILKQADFFVCISQSVSKDAQNFLQSGYPQIRWDKKAFGYCHLGAELDLVSRDNTVRQELRTVFDVPKSARPYVCISTFEPRKNHDYILDAFDRAWAQGLPVSLLLAGKHGWKCEKLLQRIDRHPLRNKRLWVFHDLNDDEVLYCYRRGRAMISSSRIEGFGLPVVEALSCGCEAWLSDIAVYHEVGGDFCLYFDLNSPESLLQMLLANERAGGIHPPRPVSEFSWPNWRTSTKKLLCRILEMSEHTIRGYPSTGLENADSLKL